MQTNRLKLYIFSCIFSIILTIPFCELARGAELSFAPAFGENSLTLTLMIDRANKLAGMKVTVIYDKENVTLKKADKSDSTGSFLHVVNDKTPGKVIIVMASAKGISGDNLELCTFQFEGKFSSEKPLQDIMVTQVQLMSEDLVEIPSNKPVFSFQTSKKQ